MQRFKGVCLVIGDPVEHSLSPRMHNAAYKKLEIEDKYAFIKCHVGPSDLADFIKSARRLRIRGICCTIPHKVKVIPYLDEIDNVAKKIGAVNTVVNDNGVLKGYNTDWLGVLAPLEKLTDIKNKSVVLLGAGGAARAACFAVSKKSGKLTIYNRTFEKAQELAVEFGAKALFFEKLDNVKNADIIINATSVGLYPNKNETPLSKKYISKNQIVFDLVYSSSGETKLLKEAKEKGAKTISGIEMLLHQAFMQFKLFTEFDAPENVMRKVIS